MTDTEERLKFTLTQLRPFFEGEHSYDHPHNELIRWALDGGEWPKGLPKPWPEINRAKNVHRVTGENQWP